MPDNSLDNLLSQLLDLARAEGADTADALIAEGRSLGVSVRGGELEDVDSTEGRDLGLRVLVGQRQACVSTSDTSLDNLKEVARRAVAMAKLAPEDQYAGLAPKDELATEFPDLDLIDPTTMDAAALKAMALETETAALAVEGVMQAEGAGAQASRSRMIYMNSDGFHGGWAGTSYGASVSAIAANDAGMERDYDYHSTRWLEDLRAPSEIGTLAGTRAVGRLGSRKMPSGARPVIFDRRVSAGMLRALAGAISGGAVARGVSFLKDKMGEQLFAPGITVTDDALRPRGDGSRPFDGEGVRSRKTPIIKDGKLQTWLLHSPSARQLGLNVTGHGSRGVSSPPGISSTNFYMNPGARTREDMITSLKDGLLITEMFGPSINSNTGDYSVGCAGVAIVNGELAHPVSEITVAGNLLDMYKTLEPASDLVFEGATNAPSILFESLAVAGE